MKKTITSKGKITIFLLLCIFLIFIYVITIPTKNIHYKSYTFHLFGIIYSFIILCSIVIIDLEKIVKKDYIIALCLGLLSIGVTSPINYMGVLSGICTLFAYLGSMTLSAEYNNKIILIRSTEFKYIMESIAVILSIVCAFIFIEWTLGKNPAIFNFEIIMLFRAIGAGISEEIIFRLFIFSIILHICKGEEPPKLLTFFVMVIPFALLHVIDQAVYNGFINSLYTIIQIVLIITPITMLAWKKDLFNAIGVHIIYDLVSMSF